MTGCQAESERSQKGGVQRKKPRSEAPMAAARLRNSPQRTLTGAHAQKGPPKATGRCCDETLLCPALDSNISMSYFRLILHIETQIMDGQINKPKNLLFQLLLLPFYL